MAATVLERLAYDAPRRVDWRPAATSLHAILDGTSLFQFPTILRVLVATGADTTLAKPLLANGGEMVLAYLAAQHPPSRTAAHQLLIALAGRDLGENVGPWRDWIASLSATSANIAPADTAVAEEIKLHTPTGDLSGTLLRPPSRPPSGPPSRPSSRPSSGPQSRPSSGPPLVVLIVAGSGPTDRYGNSIAGVSANSYKILADSLAGHGIASVRYQMFCRVARIPPTTTPMSQGFNRGIQAAHQGVRNSQLAQRSAPAPRSSSPQEQKRPPRRRKVARIGNPLGVIIRTTVAVLTRVKARFAQMAHTVIVDARHPLTWPAARFEHVDHTVVTCLLHVVKKFIVAILP